MQVLHEGSLNSETVLESWFFCWNLFPDVGGVGTGTTSGMNDMGCHKRHCWMCLAVQDVLFCISVTAAGAGLFPHTNCSVPSIFSSHSKPEPGSLKLSVPPCWGFPLLWVSLLSQLPWIIPFKQEPEEAAALQHCSPRSESPPWFWGLPVSYFCRVSHFSFQFQRK